MAKKKGKFWRFGAQKNKNKDISKIQYYGFHEYGNYKINSVTVNKERNKRKREEAHITEEVEEEIK